MPGSPFAVVGSRDGRWLFASLRVGREPGIAVLRRDAAGIELLRVAGMKTPAGLVLTHDGSLLVAAAIESVGVMDTARLTSGEGDPMVATFDDGPGAFSLYANVTADDKLLFVSDEGAQTITVVDLERARREGFGKRPVVGKIPVGKAPIALTFSPDGRWLYTTSEKAARDWNWPVLCKPEGEERTEPVNPEGAVLVVDVAKAHEDPAHSVVARVSAACSPVRMAIAPEGDRIYVTVRNSDALLAFDTARLVSDPPHSRIATVPVGPSPVPVAVVDGGRKIVVGNSDRFGQNSNQPQTLTVVDAGRIAEGAAAVLGTFPVGAFPRGMALSPDGHTLFLANYNSNTLQVIEVAKLPGR